MNYEWTPDSQFPGDLDLFVTHPGRPEYYVAFVRKMSAGLFVCRFMDLTDGEGPDGKTYKTQRSAKRWCEKHAPALWIAYQSAIGDEA